jgi:hypothetical protein
MPRDKNHHPPSRFTMKTAKTIITASLFVIATSFAFAGPGPQYWAQRRTERARAVATKPADMAKATESCCRVVTVQRPIASHKVSLPVKSVECSGCAAMQAGEKCPMS